MPKTDPIIITSEQQRPELLSPAVFGTERKDAPPSDFKLYVRPPRARHSSGKQEFGAGMVKHIQKRITGDSQVRKAMGDEAYFEFLAAAEFMTVRELRTPAGKQIPLEISYTPGGRIADQLMFDIVGGADDRGWYPVYDKSIFFAPSQESMLAPPRKEPVLIDVRLSFASVTMAVYGARVESSPREIAAGVLATNKQLMDYKRKVLLNAFLNAIERDKAEFITTDTNYHANHRRTMATTEQWQLEDSTPLEDVATMVRTINKATRAPELQKLFWMGGDVLTALQQNKALRFINSVSAASPTNALLTPEFLSSIFRMPLVVGESGVSTTIGADPSDVWGQDAGIVIPGSNDPMELRFCANIVSEGYPIVYGWRDESKDTRWIDNEKRHDSWNPTGILNTAGAIFKGASKAY